MALTFKADFMNSKLVNPIPPNNPDQSILALTPRRKIQFNLMA